MALPARALEGIDPDALDLEALGQRLAQVPGIVGVVLGGSRARGTHRPDSDVDLGLYYRGTFDVAALRTLARAVAGPEAEVTDRGGWGPWVDGGGWLHIGGVAVDWLYRDLGRVEACWALAQEGRFAWNTQIGHPMGVPDFAYVGELALGVPLADPTGQLGRLRAELTYPPALQRALVASLWEADFLVRVAAKAVARDDTAYLALCRSRAVLLCAHALCAVESWWVVNEKGVVALAAQSGWAPTGFEQRAAAAVADQEMAAALVADVTSRCREALQA